MLTLSLLLVLLSQLVLSEDKPCAFNQMVEPDVINTFGKTDITLSIEACPFKVNRFDKDGSCKAGGELMFELTTRCYCYTHSQGHKKCSVPGPTLLLYAHSKINIHLDNKLTGSVEEKSPDITNLHTHGLHIGSDQDNVLIKVLPGTKKTYTYDILTQHYPGTHWYHPHYHGSTSLQVAGGLYGALIVENKYRGSRTSYKENYAYENVINLASMFITDSSVCKCGKQLEEDSMKNPAAYFYESTVTEDNLKNKYRIGISSLCFDWCFGGFSADALTKSSVPYNAKVPNAKKYEEIFLVNGKYQPVHYVDGYKQYYRYRIVSSSNAFYTQLKFENNMVGPDQCTYWLMARDGIRLYTHKKLNEKPFYNYYMLPPGGRIDVAIYCKHPKTLVTVYQSEQHTHYDNIHNEYVMGRYGDKKKRPLFFIQFGDKWTWALESGSWSFILNSYPVIHNSWFPYLTNMLDGKLSAAYKAINHCGCKGSPPEYDYTQNVEITKLINQDRCVVELHSGLAPNGAGQEELNRKKFEVNGIHFTTAEATPAIYEILGKKIYEFDIFSQTHPYHQHVYPFQIQEDLLDGYIAEKGMWLDTLGYIRSFKIRNNLADYFGKQVLHCHFLGHEDLGMLGYINVVTDGSVCNLHTSKFTRQEIYTLPFDSSFYMDEDEDIDEDIDEEEDNVDYGNDDNEEEFIYDNYKVLPNANNNYSQLLLDNKMVVISIIMIGVLITIITIMKRNKNNQDSYQAIV